MSGPALAEGAGRDALAAEAPSPAPSRTLPRARRSRGPLAHGGRALLGLLPPALLALGWEAAVAWGLASGRLLPPPSRVGAALWGLAASGDLAMHVGATLARVGLGFALGAAAGILAGTLVATLPRLRWLADPSLQGLRAVPSLAWVPLFILWFGILETPKVTLIAVGVFFPVYVGVAGAIASVDRKLVEVGRVFRLSRVALARRILLPAVLPATLVALRTGLGLGFLFVVAAELMGASEGLGYLLVDGQQFGKPDQILAAIIAFAVVGKLADALLVGLTGRLVRWQDTARDDL